MRKARKFRIILDTNLWISFLISKRLKKIDTLFHQDNIILIFSEELLEEFITVAQRPKFNKYFSDKDLENILNLFDVFGELIKVTSVVEVCRDEKDNFLLALAKDGNVDFLITGDDDLLSINIFENTTILNYKKFELEVQTE